MAPVSASASLFRSASSSSLASSSDDPFLFETPNPTTKRTRKRFTGSQLTMLEQLFHHATHPSRDEREALARELNLYDCLFFLLFSPHSGFRSFVPSPHREPKVVTIWFQNRRQNERKANLAPSTSASEPSSSSPAVRRSPRRKPSHTSTSTSNSRSHSHSSSPYAHPPNKSLSRRPTLETMALRSELRTAPPRTPLKRPDPSKSPWDNMPSSPLAPPPSPPEREFVQFAMGRHRQARSLEWACAAARLVGKGKDRGPGDANGNYNDNDDDETDEEDLHEAITPIGSLTGDGGRGVFWDARTRRTSAKATNMENTKDPESELMDAALLLCGLGRKVA